MCRIRGWKRLQARQSRSVPRTPPGSTAASRVPGRASRGPPQHGQQAPDPWASCDSMAPRSRWLNCRQLEVRLRPCIRDASCEGGTHEANGCKVRSLDQPARGSSAGAGDTFDRDAETSPQLGLGHGAEGPLRRLPTLPTDVGESDGSILLARGVEDQVPASVMPGRLLLEGSRHPLLTRLVGKRPHNSPVQSLVDRTLREAACAGPRRFGAKLATGSTFAQPETGGEREGEFAEGSDAR